MTTRIPRFPDFAPISLERHAEVAPFLSAFGTICSDYSFVNLFCWDTDGTGGLAWLNGNLVVRLPNYQASGRPQYSVMGRSRVAETVDELLRTVDELVLVPEHLANTIAQDGRFRVAESRDDFDYLYDVEALTHLRGSTYNHKRRQLRRFDDAVDDCTIRTFSGKSAAGLASDIRPLVGRWANAVAPMDDVGTHELIALDRLFDNLACLDVELTLCVVNGEIAGFSVQELLHGRYAICHFEKADRSGKFPVHLPTKLAVEAVRSLNGRVAVVNWEQDLGIPGLRTSKTSYRPIALLKKYAIATDA